jgi:hypothetical protein
MSIKLQLKQHESLGQMHCSVFTQKDTKFGSHSMSKFGRPVTTEIFTDGFL